MTYGLWYWPIWLGVILIGFLPAEIIGLIQGGQNTFSNWVWQYLKVAKNESIANWTATDFLLFGAWLVLIVWLTFHLFFRKFT